MKRKPSAKSSIEDLSADPCATAQRLVRLATGLLTALGELSAANRDWAATRIDAHDASAPLHLSQSTYRTRT